MNAVPTLPPLPPLRDVIRRHSLAARKSLGQNFLLDLNVTRRIARAAGVCPGDNVLEIGPGPGGLTRSLLEQGARHIVAVERDIRCLPALAEIAAAYPGRLTPVQADALEMDFFETPPLPNPAKVVANLPYNIATPLLTRWLLAHRWPPWWRSLTLMLQREVADRISAHPGSRAYGRLSVISQWRARPRILFNVTRQAFTPPPAVTSTIVHFEPVSNPFPVAPAMLERVTAAAFGQRRKMLRSSLKTLTDNPEALLNAAGLNGADRAEVLTVLDFCRLTSAFTAQHDG